MSPYVEQVAQALAVAMGARDTEQAKRLHPDEGAVVWDHATELAPRVDAALMRAYWQGWDDGITERGKIQPSGAAGRGVLAALGELRGSHTPTPEPPQ